MSSMPLRVTPGKALYLLLSLSLLAVLCTCGGGGSGSGSSSGSPSGPVVTSVSLTASQPIVRVGDGMSFTLTMQGIVGQFDPAAVQWTVNGIKDGDATNGTITTTGAYSAPANIPPTNPVVVKVTSTQDPSKSATATVSIYTISITPQDPTVLYSNTQQFTAIVTGLNYTPTIEWTAVYGSFDANGLYTAPAEILGIHAQDKVTAGVNSQQYPEEYSPTEGAVTLKIPNGVLTSITPSSASATENVAIKGNYLYGPTEVRFPMVTGGTMPVNFYDTGTQINVTVPLGAVSGPVTVTLVPYQGIEEQLSIPFTRLPNLKIHSPNKDLSSGETMQFDSRLLGASSPNQINWTAQHGTISTSGFYQAPTVMSETYDMVTACLPGTNSCDSLLLRVLPFRITPAEPVVSMGGQLQLEAIQGSSQLNAQWSVLAGGGSINGSGLFSAPTDPTLAGPVLVSANVSGSVQQTSIAVTGGFPGLVSRTNDYLNFKSPTEEGTSVGSVTTSGNLAYGVSGTSPYKIHPPTSISVDTYDITDPRQPAWLDSTESLNSIITNTFVSGNYLVQVTGVMNALNNIISVYTIQGSTLVPTTIAQAPPFKEANMNNGIVYGMGESTPNPGDTTFPIYTVSVQNGAVLQNRYNLPFPYAKGVLPIELLCVSGSGNYVYASMISPLGSTQLKTIAAYDISQNPPALVASIGANSGFDLQVVNQLLFSDYQVFDISNHTPTWLVDFPDMWGVAAVQGNQVAAYGYAYDYQIIDVSNPAAPVIAENITDMEFPAAASFANNTLLTADDTGGLGSYDVSAQGGPKNSASAGFAFITGESFQAQTMYTSVLNSVTGYGGETAVDVSGGAPTVIGSLLYPNDVGLCVQVSVNTLFMGLSDSLKAVNVTNPASPVLLASLAIPTNTLAISGTTLFAGTVDNRLLVFNVANPAAPQQIGSATLPATAVNMIIAGTLLFVADGPQGMLIFDVSNPASPTKLSQFTPSAPIWDIGISGTTALVAADSLGLLSLDVSNPMQVTQVGQTALPTITPFPLPGAGSIYSPAVSITVQNNWAYVGTADNIAMGFDITQPVYPRLVNFNVDPFGYDYGFLYVLGITPFGNNLYHVIGADVAQVDNTLPRNAIERYEEPPALTLLQPPVNQNAQIKRRVGREAGRHDRRKPVTDFLRQFRSPERGVD